MTGRVETLLRVAGPALGPALVVQEVEAELAAWGSSAVELGRLLAMRKGFYAFGMIAHHRVRPHTRGSWLAPVRLPGVTAGECAVPDNKRAQMVRAAPTRALTEYGMMNMGYDKVKPSDMPPP